MALSDGRKISPQGPQATELEADRKPKLHTGGNVLIRGATVMTVAHGNSPQTDVLILAGKIARIGQGLSVPAATRVIDAQGMYVMPGIIDTHCHFAVAGGVNEFSLSIVPEGFQFPKGKEEAAVMADEVDESYFDTQGIDDRVSCY